MEKSLADILCKTSTIVDGNMSFRIGDTKNSLQNRTDFLKSLRIPATKHICMKCDHGKEIVVVTHDTHEAGATTQEEMLTSEVLVTQEKGLALMLLTADCLPVSFFDPVTQTIALAHFSRETISKMLPQKTVGFLREHLDITPANLLIGVGPHIHTESYSFHPPAHNIQPEILPFTTEKDGYIFVDLVTACTTQLIQTGVSPENTSVSEIDTVTSSHHFSHHRSTKQNDPEGRFATIVMLPT